MADIFQTVTVQLYNAGCFLWHFVSPEPKGRVAIADTEFCFQAAWFHPKPLVLSVLAGFSNLPSFLYAFKLGLSDPSSVDRLSVSTISSKAAHTG